MGPLRLLRPVRNGSNFGRLKACVAKLLRELPVIEQAVGMAADAVAVWARKGIEFCMNQYN